MKKKQIYQVSIIDYSNYGNRLQAYAIQRIFYRNSIFEISRRTNKTVNFSKTLKKLYYFYRYRGVRWILSQLYFRFFSNDKKFQNLKLSRHEKGREFTNQNIKQLNSNDINSLKSKDGFMFFGSDQIFHPLAFDDELYKLESSFDGYVVAFSASFGTRHIESHDASFWKFLNTFNLISFRERLPIESERFLTNAHFTLPDPTLLLEKSEWIRFATNRYVNGVDLDGIGKYALLYFIQRPGDHLYSSILNFIKSCKDPMDGIVVVNDPNFSDFYDLSPSDFVNLVSKATHIFSDSFHSCCFSSIFNKPISLFAIDNRGMDNTEDRILNIGLDSDIEIEFNRRTATSFHHINLSRDKIVKSQEKSINEFFQKLEKLGVAINKPC